MESLKPYNIFQHIISPQDQEQIYAYLQPIVSGCGGFIKSNGYMLILNDILVMMSHDRAMMSAVHIQPLNMIYIASIKDFINAKNDTCSFVEKTRFVGSYQIYKEIENIFYMYHEMDMHSINTEGVYSPIFQENDMFVFPTFQDNVKQVTKSVLKITNGIEYYCIPVSKAIFPINKDDQCSLKVFDWTNDPNTRIFKYEVYKKKLKTTIHIYTKQFIFHTGG